MFKLEPKERLFCEKCGKLVGYNLKTKAITYKVKDVDITIYDGISAYCKFCGNELLDPFYEDYNLNKAYFLYYEKKFKEYYEWVDSGYDNEKLEKFRQKKEGFYEN